MQREVVFILSTNYAGSHLVSLSLGSHSTAAHVGEVCHLRKADVQRPVCIRCGSAGACTLLKDIGPATADRAYDLIFAALPPGKTLIVDNSKKADWAERFLERPDYRARILFLIRDPRALVRRWDLYYKTPAQIREQRWRVMRRTPSLAFRTAFAPPRLLWAYKWLDHNRRISDLLRRRRVDHLVTTYMDFAQDTEGELRRIMTWLGRPFEPAQLEYWAHDHHGSQKPDYEWVKSEKKRFFDVRWKQELPPDEQEAIRAIGPIRDYLDGLGVRWTDDGLTLRPATT